MQTKWAERLGLRIRSDAIFTLFVVVTFLSQGYAFQSLRFQIRPLSHRSRTNVSPRLKRGTVLKALSNDETTSENRGDSAPLENEEANMKEMMARFRTRWNKDGPSKESQEGMSESHPALVNLAADAFAHEPASLRTTVSDKGDGNRQVQLLWSPSGDVLAEGEERGAEEVVVGELEFFLGISSVAGDRATRGKLERILGGRVALLQNVHVVTKLRGQGGGDVLVRRMAEDLLDCWRSVGEEDQEDGQFVALKHLDNGSGKLIRWYKQLGFLPAKDTKAGQGGAAAEDLMIAELETLHGRLNGQQF